MDKRLEDAIDEVGRDRVFALMEAHGWSHRSGAGGRRCGWFEQRTLLTHLPLKTVLLTVHVELRIGAVEGHRTPLEEEQR